MLCVKSVLNTSLKCFNVSNKWMGFSNFSSFSHPLNIHSTEHLLAAPKKRKVESQFAKIRDEKKRRRLYREIKRLLNQPRQLKPLDEIETPYHLVDEPQKYERTRVKHNIEVLEERADTLVQWSQYRLKMHMEDMFTVDKIGNSQYKALEALAKLSPTLYEKAIQIDETFLPFTANGTSKTALIPNYDTPDGEYVDITRPWNPPELPEEGKKGQVNAKKYRFKNPNQV